MSASNGKTVRACVYLRMSKDEQTHSIERQQGQVYPYAKQQGYTVVKEYRDEGIQGWKDGDKRPDFQRMLEDAQKGLWEVILTDDVDRFGRFDLHKYGSIVVPLREAGIRLETVAQGRIDWDDTLSQLSDAIRMAFRKEESSNTSRRILTRFVLMARQGCWPGGSPPYGYVKDSKQRRKRLGEAEEGATGKLIFDDPAKVRVVQWMFQTYADSDVSLRWLADELHRRGVPSPTGRERWSGQAIGKLFHNRNYLGDLHWNEVSSSRFQEYDGKSIVRSKARGNKKEYRRRAEPEIIVTPSSHQAMIERDVFERVQAKLAGNREHSTPKVRGGGFLLAGLMVCGHCGSRMIGRTGYGPRKHGTVYVCNGYQRWGKAFCSCHYIYEETLIPFLVQKLQDDFLNPGNLDKLRAELRRQAEAERRRDPTEAKRLKAKLKQLEDKIAKGNRNMALADPDAIAGISQAVREWRKERDETAKALAALEEAPDTAGVETAIAEAEAALWRLREFLTAGNPCDVRAVLRELVSHVELWWEHREVGSFRKTRFSRGLIHLRPDEQIVHTCQLFQWSGTGMTTSARSPRSVSPASSAHSCPINSATLALPACLRRRTTSRRRPS
jgi:site-specific DNA recombinase